MNWDQRRILVHSPKTEHHKGKEARLIPLFPELHEPVMDVLEQADPKTEYVITRCRKANCNLRSQLERIVGKAVLKPWLRLFQNLRNSRETELAETFPVHVVTAQIGNTPEMAQDHYLQLWDDYFQRTASLPVDTSKSGTRDKEEGIEMKPDTISRMASMSKPITSVAVMMLYAAEATASRNPSDTRSFRRDEPGAGRGCV